MTQETNTQVVAPFEKPFTISVKSGHFNCSGKLRREDIDDLTELGFATLEELLSSERDVNSSLYEFLDSVGGTLTRLGRDRLPIADPGEPISAQDKDFMAKALTDYVLANPAGRISFLIQGPDAIITLCGLMTSQSATFTPRAQLN